MEKYSIGPLSPRSEIYDRVSPRSRSQSTASKTDIRNFFEATEPSSTEDHSAKERTERYKTDKKLIRERYNAYISALEPEEKDQCGRTFLATFLKKKASSYDEERVKATTIKIRTSLLSLLEHVKKKGNWDDPILKKAGSIEAFQDYCKQEFALAKDPSFSQDCIACLSGEKTNRSFANFVARKTKDPQLNTLDVLFNATQKFAASLGMMACPKKGKWRVFVAAINDDSKLYCYNHGTRTLCDITPKTTKQTSNTFSLSIGVPKNSSLIVLAKKLFDQLDTSSEFRNPNAAYNELARKNALTHSLRSTPELFDGIYDSWESCPRKFELKNCFKEMKLKTLLAESRENHETIAERLKRFAQEAAKEKEAGISDVAILHLGE